MSRDMETKRAIGELNATAMDAFRRGDAAAIAAGFTKEGKVLMPNAPMAEGREAIRQVWAGMLALPNAAARWGSSFVETAASGDLAYEVGTYSLSYDGNPGRVEDRGKYVVVWKKEDGAWKIAADILNSDKPAAG